MCRGLLQRITLCIDLHCVPLVLFDLPEQPHHQITMIDGVGSVVDSKVPIARWAQVMMEHIDVKRFDFFHINVIAQEIVYDFFGAKCSHCLLVVHIVWLERFAQQRTVPHLPLLNPTQGNGVQSITVATTPFIGIHRILRKIPQINADIQPLCWIFEHCKLIIFQITIQSHRINAQSVPVDFIRRKSANE